MFGLKQFVLVLEISLYAHHVVRLGHVRHVQCAHLVGRHDLAHVIRHHEHQPVRHVGLELLEVARVGGDVAGGSGHQAERGLSGFVL